MKTSANEKESEAKTEIVFFHKGKKILNIEEYIESQLSCKKIPTIGKILDVLTETTFHYKIITELEICEKATVDGLAGHYINEFLGTYAQCYDIYRKGREQYVIVCVDFNKIGGNYVFDEEGYGKSATSRNMKKYCDYDKLTKNDRSRLNFGGSHKLLSKEGKLRVPGVFKDYVYPQDQSSEFDHYLDSVKVTFKFDHVEDCEIGNNIFEFVEVEKNS